MKRLLTTLVALAIGMTAFAQYGYGRYGGPGYGRGAGYRPGPGYGYFQDSAFELGLTLNHFTTWEKDGLKAYRPDRVGFFAEYRVDIDPFIDMGLQLSTTFGKGSMDTEITSPDMWYWQGAPLVVMDFNLLPYSGFNPYIGLGIGPGFGFERDTINKEGNWTHALVLSPRAGIELFEHLRMSVQYQWYLNGSYTFSHFAFGLSWAFQPGMRGARPMMRR